MLGINDPTLFWIAVTLPLMAFWVAAYWDIFFRRDLPFTRKLLWGVVIFFTTYIGLAAYFLSRPLSDPPGKGSGQSIPRTSAIVGELEQLTEAHARGEVSADAFLARKRELLGLS